MKKTLIRSINRVLCDVGNNASYAAFLRLFSCQLSSDCTFVGFPSRFFV